ncbi:MAG: hypothetical protein KF746_27390 [Chitinophagaceae bacterium]|nr:hypothetical protein [Chitinophagaceae bacterium]
MNETYSYEVEAYAWIVNVDKSVLKLNSILRKYGYSFTLISLEELEENFSDLFGFPVDFQSKNQCTLNRFDEEVNGKDGDIRKAVEKIRAEKLQRGIPREEIGSTISMEFHELLMHNVPNGSDILRDHGLILLKRIQNFDQLIINNTFTDESIFKISREISEFVRLLIQRMRLFKNGDVVCRTEFQVTCNTRKVIQRFKPSSFATGGAKFTVNDDDLTSFEAFLNDNIDTNHLTELALSTFNLAYFITELKSRYLNYMICLESLFNRNAAEISHTISRHLAIVLSNNQHEFNTNYSRIKELYNYRNAIIHGRELKENITVITAELQGKVRNAINYCLKCQMTKEQLFTYLNSKGF